MLAYLEDLCAALIAHDAVAIQRLLAHPLARSLPRRVREEALAISRANPSSLRAPIQTLRFYHQCLQLRESDDSALPTDSDSEESRGRARTDDQLSDSGTDTPNEPTDLAPVSPPAETTGLDVDAEGRRVDEEPGREQIELPFDLRAPTAVAA